MVANFVATRDLSPTIFHFKEKWKQLFDLGILGGARGGGGEERRGGEGCRETKGERQTAEESVRKHLSVCVASPSHSTDRLMWEQRRGLVCAEPWAAEDGRQEGKRRGERATPSPAPGWLDSIGPSGKGPGGSRSRF